jgi:AraC-like DNA-binding protein
MFMDKGAATMKADLNDVVITDGQLIFGLPNQIFTNRAHNKEDKHFVVSFDESTLALLPQSYPFLLDPLQSNLITFDAEAKERVKAVFSSLFQLLHLSGKQKKVEIILAYINTLLTEINSAYFEQAQANPDVVSNAKLSKYVEFKLAVEKDLAEQHDVQAIAEKLAMTTSTLYGVVKDFSGVSPKEWITNRLMLEAQRKLQYSSISTKELAYELGFKDPAYFSRLFKKNTGRSVSEYLAGLRDLSSN